MEPRFGDLAQLCSHHITVQQRRRRSYLQTILRGLWCTAMAGMLMLMPPSLIPAWGAAETPASQIGSDSWQAKRWAWGLLLSWNTTDAIVAVLRYLSHFPWRFRKRQSVSGGASSFKLYSRPMSSRSRRYADTLSLPSHLIWPLTFKFNLDFREYLNVVCEMETSIGGTSNFKVCKI